MGGLANSRHAPAARKPSPNNHHATTAPPLPPAKLTVPPAPIDAGPSPPDHASASLSTKRTTAAAAAPAAPPTTDSHQTQHPNQASQHQSRKHHHSYGPHHNHPAHHSPEIQNHNHRPYVSTSPTAPDELARCAKLVRRLHWKLPFLKQAYAVATSRVGVDPAVVAENEIMFKLDFFEFYMLIERVVVHLLGVWGVVVDRHGGGEHGMEREMNGEGSGHKVQGTEDLEGRKVRDKEEEGDGKRRGGGLAGSRWRREARHRYHANVLASLDNVSCPLFPTLGTGEVRKQLGRAKDLRNRWKTAGEEDEEERDQPNPDNKRTKKVAAPLETYQLEHMLDVIFDGFAAAYKAAERDVKGAPLSWADDVEMLGEDGKPIDWAAAARGGEEQWEFMVDAMDWEAV
ncbi:hypothetical protein VTI74DRAFT_10246 [Chaetomium olivicolor]